MQINNLRTGNKRIIGNGIIAQIMFQDFVGVKLKMLIA